MEAVSAMWAGRANAVIRVSGPEGEAGDPGRQFQRPEPSHPSTPQKSPAPTAQRSVTLMPSE